jgi:hypothetical protein
VIPSPLAWFQPLDSSWPYLVTVMSERILYVWTFLFLFTWCHYKLRKLIRVYVSNMNQSHLISISHTIPKPSFNICHKMSWTMFLQ